MEKQSRRERRTQGQTPWWAVAWFATLMLITAWVRLADPTGWLGSDDAAYHRAAEHILTGKTIERYHHHNARAAMIVPVAASIALFGASPATVAFPTFLASMMCVALVAILGRWVWSWWEGLCAASVVSVLPFFRVLSTTAYGDVPAVFWAALAMALAVGATRAECGRRAALMGGGSGLAIGLAFSVKIFAAIVVVGIALFAWASAVGARRKRRIVFASIAGGCLAYVLIDGLFYTWAADDFWFKLHALQASEARDGDLSPNPYDLAGYAQLVWARLGLLLDTRTSGWGRIGVTFWPVVLAVAVFSRRGRSLGLWAIAGYLLIAAVPVSFRNGPQPFPFCDGRYLLVACVPFALCLAWAIRRTAGAFVPSLWLNRGWPVVLTAIVALALVGRRELNGFRDRSTSRVGLAIEQIITATDWDDHREIFLPASLYLRHRILFPPELRKRLRVAVDDRSPTWWRNASIDIAERHGPLPPPGQAYLLATPRQWSGAAEEWDYGVQLPQEALAAWQRTPPTARIARFEDRTIGPATADQDGIAELVVLLAGDIPGDGVLEAGSSGLAERPHRSRTPAGADIRLRRELER